MISIDEIRQVMLCAWDGVDDLVATARKAHFRVDDHPARSRFLRPEDVITSVHQYKAWWQAPDHWRLDQTFFNGRVLSYVTVGDEWTLWRDGVPYQNGSVTRAKETQFTRGDDLIFGRPYLGPAENAQLWAWLNPALWATSCSLLVDDGYQPSSDDVDAPDEIVHVLASQSWRHDLMDRDRANKYKTMMLDDWDRDMDIGECVNFWQLWIDMKTGFLRRITGESGNGRLWDIMVDSVLINQSSGVGSNVFDRHT